MNKSKFGNFVAQEMNRIAEDPKHLTLFKKASQCCAAACKCDGDNCKCAGECDKSCHCNLNKKASDKEVIEALLSLSEKLDHKGLDKSALFALDSANRISKFAIKPQEIFDIPLRGEEFPSKEINPLEEEIDELEKSPDYEELDEILKDPEIVRIMNEMKKHKDLEEGLANYEPELPSLEDTVIDVDGDIAADDDGDDELSRIEESGYTHGRLEPHKFESTRDEYASFKDKPELLEAYIAGFHKGEEARTKNKKIDLPDDYEVCGTCGYDHDYEYPLLKGKELTEFMKAHKGDFAYLEPEDRKFWEDKLKEEDELNADDSRGRCNCENIECFHPAGECSHKAGEQDAMYVGPLCDDCAELTPKQYLIDKNNPEGPIDYFTQDYDKPYKLPYSNEFSDKDLMDRAKRYDVDPDEFTTEDLKEVDPFSSYFEPGFDEEDARDFSMDDLEKEVDNFIYDYNSKETNADEYSRLYNEKQKILKKIKEVYKSGKKPSLGLQDKLYEVNARLDSIEMHKDFGDL